MSPDELCRSMCVYAYIHDRYLNILAKRSKYYGPANIMVEFSRLVDFSLRGSRLYDCPLGYPKIKKNEGCTRCFERLDLKPLALLVYIFF
jgi:hypothetical protein